MSFLALFSSLIGLSGLILQIMKVLIVPLWILDYVRAFFHLLEMLTLFAAEYESAKKFIKFNEIIETASLTDLHCRFNKLNRCSRSIRLNVFQHLTPLPGHEGWFKNHKIHFTWFNRFNKFDWFNVRFNGY